ncbi:MAG: hypothetical protein HY283_07575 [Nitrospirae bacterium]|nr:hypothetical protein [Nitrospirota bacterium]
MGRSQANMTVALIGIILMITILWVHSFPAFGEEQALQTITRLCGRCHGLTLNDQCLTGACQGGRSHAITPQPWDMVIPWMKAMGCTMTESEQKSMTEYLMLHYGKTYLIRWEQAGAASGGWNVVSFGIFHDRLYAGIEGSGSILRLDENPSGGGPSWKTVLETPNYTVYGLTRFQDKFFAATNDPAAEIWTSADGEQWHTSARLPEERGIISMGLFKGSLYAGTTRASLYRSSDGVTWTRLAALLPNAGSAFTNWVRFILPFDGALYVGIEKAGIFRSENGTTWSPVWPVKEDRPPKEPFSGVRGAAVFNGVLYIGTTGSGEIWAIGSKAGPRPVRVFTADLKTTRGYIGSMTVFGDFLYAGIGGTVFRTKAGRLWEEAGRLGPFTIEAMAAFDHQLYAGTTLPPNAWIYRTTGLAPKSSPIPTPGESKND